jgi:DNA-binding NtrC family response regulator
MTFMAAALLIEDDESSLAAMQLWVRSESYEPVLARSLGEAREALALQSPGIVFLDLNLPDGDGLELFDDLAGHTETEVVVITGNATIDSAVEAMRRGALDYLTKPVDMNRLKNILARVSRTQEIRQNVRNKRLQGDKEGRFGPLIGRSEAMRRVFDTIARVAPTDARVMILGETGVGKELARGGASLCGQCRALPRAGRRKCRAQCNRRASNDLSGPA